MNEDKEDKNERNEEEWMKMTRVRGKKETFWIYRPKETVDDYHAVKEIAHSQA